MPISVFLLLVIGPSFAAAVYFGFWQGKVCDILGHTWPELSWLTGVSHLQNMGSSSAHVFYLDDCIPESVVRVV